MLNISKDLKLPLDAITGTFAILAIRGSGKSHTACVMAEEMLKAGQPIVAYDPTGAWWGLKSSADGKRAGFPVVIFGGEHADVPLEETAGETIASTIVEKRIPAILDCSLLRKGARIRFMTTFCETLYHKNREPLHLFLDEVQTVAPQNIRAMPEASRLLGAVEDIILQGRRRGLGLTAISPRPAVVNANVRSACQTLIAMRVGSGKLDRKAIEEWVEAHGDHDTAKAMLSSLASLPTGDAWVWNPPDDIFKRVHFRDCETFDSRATPKIGRKAVTPQRMAAIDLDALGEAIKATVEKAKADDPKELRKKIADLERQLSKSVKTPQAKEPPEFREFMTKATATIKRLDQEIERRDVYIDGVIDDMRLRTNKLLDEMHRKRPILPTEISAAVKNGQSVAGPVARPPVAPRREAPQPARSHRNSPEVTGDHQLDKAQRQILAAFYWTRGEPVGPEKIAFYSRYRVSSGGFNGALGALRRAGLISGWTITAAGIDQAEAIGAEPKPNGPELREWLRPKLDRAQNTLLDVLCNAHPQRLTNEQIAEQAGYSLGSGGFNGAIGHLRTIGAIEGQTRDGGPKAADVFFE